MRRIIDSRIDEVAEKANKFFEMVNKELDKLPLSEANRVYEEKYRDAFNKLDAELDEAIKEEWLETHESLGDTKLKKVKDAADAWHGIEGARFIDHGEWSDPEVVYNGVSLNYWDIESLLPEDVDVEDCTDEDWESALLDSYYATIENYVYDAKELLEKYKESWVGILSDSIEEAEDAGEDFIDDDIFDFNLAIDALNTIDIDNTDEDGDFPSQASAISNIYENYDVDGLTDDKNFKKFCDIIVVL